MKFIIGQDRDQIPLFASSIEAAIALDHEIAYNLRRIINLIGNDRLKAYLNDYFTPIGASKFGATSASKFGANGASKYLF